jgi:hypothetical protein
MYQDCSVKCKQEETPAARNPAPGTGRSAAGLKEEMQLIVAGGGLVYTDNQTVLLIYRRGKWDLPKGKAGRRRNTGGCRRA